MTRIRRAGALLWALLTLARGLGAQELTLAEALDAALDAHPSLAAANARVVAADEAGAAARADRLPGLALTGALTRFQEPMIVAPFHSLDFTNPPTFDRTLVQGRLGARYTVFDGGDRSSRIRGAEAVSERSRFGRRATEMELLERTTAAYVRVLSTRSLLAAARAQVTALEEEHARAERSFAAGTAAELEVIRAAATLQEARAQEASAAARVGLAERSLARTMGMGPEAVAGRPFADVRGTSSVEGTSGHTSPLVLQADRSVAAAEARVAQQRAGRFPTVQAGAGVLDFGTATGRHVLEWQAGLEVSWPLFTGGARSASVRRAEADLVAARGELEMARLEVEHAIDAAMTAVVEADARTEALSLAVAQWEEVARIESLALDAGSGVQRDLLRAQAGLFQARATHAQARYDAVLARVQLARAEGILDRDWINQVLETRP